MMKTALIVSAVMLANGVLSDSHMDDMMAGMLMPYSPMFPNIIEALSGIYLDDQFSSLISAIYAANLDATLSDPDLSATFFAPNNAAFQVTLDNLGLTFGELASDVDTLSSILLYHVVPKVIFSMDLMHDMEMETLSGGVLNMNMTNEAVVVQGDANDANVLLADVTAGAGVVHVVDAVLLPLMM
eukprot:TRINITY_DN35288_c0_g3_i1.p1 TRINITY_DN35288_c0_g3~~TRINITY_DN35288_c0_g3_i1.p1  ORF type:complete len:216 (+),score=40.62 TRINITY_DN35288_c0_g3_i1:94-648(+)